MVLGKIHDALKVPLLLALSFGVYLLRPEFWPPSAQEKEETCCSGHKITVLKSVSFLTPSFIWMALFFLDGRYVACLCTEFKGENLDSISESPWEWCDQNRTLTDGQRRAQKSFYISKFVGFSLLIIVLLALLVYTCCEDHCTEKWKHVKNCLENCPNSKKQNRKKDEEELNLQEEMRKQLKKTEGANLMEQPCCSVHCQTCCSIHGQTRNRAQTGACMV
ncbi:uncharacterized protein LOC118820629 isoform X2 [Colossoma macropomum]|uniref:uncharacterized protein LOC118820629 isoform X2 n=1 Tax=Colossoma macropomum TaxID=42526 RepID=UPI00186539C3|nr:uncharacterized protein LOC118820629 isoform X2 [Colossoma macropomum]